MNVSVAMATYNGEKYIKEQLDSIICQLDINDEIVVSDDGSNDSTLEILNNYKKKYSFIKIYNGPGKGVFFNFNNALCHCGNDIIFLSDQDDVWNKDKIKIVCSIFNDNEVNLVLHNGYQWCGMKERSELISKYRKGVLKNILFSSYWGCCMAFRYSFIKKYLPFKVQGCAHDQLIGLLGELEEKTFFLNQYLIKHRVHERNLTRKRNLGAKLYFRIKLLVDFIRTILYVESKTT